MAFLRQLFGPSKDELWRQMCEQIGGDFVEGGFLKGSKVQVHHKQWTVTLDSYSESDGESHATYTRMRAPFVNKDGFRFTIYRGGFFSDLGKLLGMQDVEIGEPEFDDAYIIKGTDEDKLRRLVANSRIRQLIESLSSSAVPQLGFHRHHSATVDHSDELVSEMFQVAFCGSREQGSASHDRA
jgi:hypothetical protein